MHIEKVSLTKGDTTKKNNKPVVSKKKKTQTIRCQKLHPEGLSPKRNKVKDKP